MIRYPEEGPLSQPGTFTITFWQTMLSPHVAGLANEIGEKFYRCNYIFEDYQSEDRKKSGWNSSEVDYPSVNFHVATSEKTVDEIRSINNINILQGIRGSKFIQNARKHCLNLGNRNGVMIEYIDPRGLCKNLVRSFVYKTLFYRYRQFVDFYLAIGSATPAWLAKHGVAQTKIFPFTYFIKENSIEDAREVRTSGFRFVFVGRLVDLKRLDIVFSALANLKQHKWSLTIVGDGPMKSTWSDLATRLGIESRVEWRGALPIADVPKVIRQHDLLILPSEKEGWGAVVSEALILGTPVICSDQCGASIAVSKLNGGKVFPFSSPRVLTSLLSDHLVKGPLSDSDRSSIAQRSSVLCARFGAVYLSQIIAHQYEGALRPKAYYVLS